jgi:hypothetical protein
MRRWSYSVLCLCLLCFGYQPWVVAQVRKMGAKNSAPVNSPANRFQQIQNLMRSGQHLQAAGELYRLKKTASGADQQAAYLLGLSLKAAGFFELAALQFVDVIRMGKGSYYSPAVRQLLEVADRSGDEAILQYAVTKSNEDFSGAPGLREIYALYKSEELSQAGQHDEALSLLRTVPVSSSRYFSAQYKAYLISLRAGQVDRALTIAQQMLSQARTRSDRELLVLALGRAAYQKKDFDRAIAFYSSIPRDSQHWPQSLFELSWAQLRAARFRSVIGTMQTLHSPFFAEEYLPETFIVRSIVYLYICRFDEAEKTLDVFEKQQGAVARAAINFYNNHGQNLDRLWDELSKAQKALAQNQLDRSYQGSLPFPVAKLILRDGQAMRYLQLHRYLAQELQQAQGLQGPLGNYAKKALMKRRKYVENKLANLAKNQLSSLVNQWRELSEQAGFIRYEIINGKKEILKSKIAGKETEGTEIDSDIKRDFYIAAGYEYWPVDQEVWLDELGNYHFMGQQQCK